MTTEDDVKDVPVPDWKKKALEKKLDPTTVPIGDLSWNTEASASAAESKN